MMKSKKKYEGIGLYEEDWEAIENLKMPRETKIGFIQAALIHEFELRRGPRQKSLTGFG